MSFREEEDKIAKTKNIEHVVLQRVVYVFNSALILPPFSTPWLVKIEWDADERK